ncbi:MAG TPA: phospho-N-acetylmuramoyl-pentapeptide-transferase, partial [Chthoniobacterales bacterium]|nr:phospho-N-acetylmuramoyl-pentapeptide-transferase [Chthoniobacterales bacterium]
MLYYLYNLSEKLLNHGIDNDFVKALNVFQYITFRSICAAVTSFLLCLMFGNRVIRKLISLKFGQPIRTKEEVHKLFELHGAKKGTPTMGGVLILGAVIISSLLWARPTNGFVWLVLIATVFLGGIGFYDDYLKVAKKSSDGISSRLKFGLQCLLAAGFTLFFIQNGALWHQAQELYVPFFKEPIALGWGAFFLYLLVIVGTSNAVNLTDGLDGLAAGCSTTVAATYAMLAYVAATAPTAQYLQIPQVPAAGELTVLCM